MMDAKAYLPILLATVADLVIGMVWYSDSLFGPMWRKLGGKPGSPKDLYRNLGMQAVAALLTATALFIAISIFQKTQTGIYVQDGFFKIFALFLQDNVQNNSLISSMKTAGFVWLGFIAPSKACHYIWGSDNWTKFGIEAVGQLTSLLVMAAIIASLS